MATATRPEPTLRLGAFDLATFVARGGMGEVWSGLARDANLPVAIKVLTAESALDPHSLEAFRSEVRAVARLRHPSITTVFDFGQVDEQAAEKSDGRLIAGSPFLVMELLPGHSIGQLIGKLSWLEFRQVMLEILSALAHTHARGVIHRDLKPGNVLLTSPRIAIEGVPAVKLSDFGIAHALEGGADPWRRDRAKGTPGYMAPEQTENRWRDFGPWTDLFSLGRLIARLLGKREQCLRLVKEAPRGLSTWIERLLEEDPALRFQRAADAAYALGELSGRGEKRAISSELQFGALDDLPSAEPTIEDGAIPTVVDGADAPASVTTATHAGRVTVVAPPMIEDWRTAEPPVAEERMPGVGLGLYGLKPIPVIERERERDILWTALNRVRRSGSSEAVVLRGASGFGKSRLAQWLCELAHETGAATILRAVHAPFPGSEHGLAAMIAGHFRCAELPRGKLLARLEPRLRTLGIEEPTDWLALTEFLCPIDDRQESDLPRLRLETMTERQNVLHRFLVQLAQERPVVVWLDDVQWGSASIEIMRRTVGSQERARILFVATVQNEALAQREVEAELLEDLLSLPRATAVEIGALQPSRHRRLVRHLLGLADGLAVRVEELTDGNPLFAEQVVGQWVQRGFLRLEENGFVLRPGATPELPGDLRELWTRRIEEVIGAHGDSAIALEIAAVLGRVVDDAEWRQVCRQAGVEVKADLIGALVDARLANIGRGTPERTWEFVHGMLRESLEHRAQGGGRLILHHKACASVLEHASSALAQERLARHLLGAGELRQAATMMGLAAVRRHHRGEYRDAQLLLAERESALDALGVADATPARLEGWLLRAKCCRTAGQLDDATSWANKAAYCGRTLHQDQVQVEALLVLESIARVRGETARAWRRAREAEARALALDSPALLGNCYKEQGWIMQTRGSLERAADLFKRGIAALERAGDNHDSQAHLASCLNGLAHSAVQRGAMAQARQYLERALAIHNKLGSGSHHALTLGSLGDVERAAGNLDAAETHYQTSLQLLEAAGYGHSEYAQMNLALIMVDRGQFKRARPVFRRALAKLETQDAGAPCGAVHAMLLPCAAAANDWDDFDYHLERARALLANGSMADADIAMPARLGGDLAASYHHQDRAVAAYRLALRQWQDLGRTDHVAEIRRLLSELANATTTTAEA